MEVGAAGGITIGTEFTVYRHTDTKLGEPLGKLIVDELMDFSAKMKPFLCDSSLTLSPPIPVLSAIQTKTGKLADFLLYTPRNDPFYALYHAIRHSDSNLQSIFLVKKKEDAHLKIWTSLPKNLLVIELTDKMTGHGDDLVTDQAKPEPKNVSWILEGAARYHHELNRTSVEHLITRGDNPNRIEVQFFKLDPPKVPPFGWTTESLTCDGQNLCRDEVIDFVVDDEAHPYGFNIINGTSADLYVNAFFFDNTNFAIREF